ncbi:AEC family transporter [Mobilitalea sibirica]|uniref:AEC family transporter n=2 Tax=Mobilitalea sibirica TaxID=1462919 RepID=A0A8J7H5A5_9FIRM|nr:AEC family transporter [Mobilitalea sibirica]
MNIVLPVFLVILFGYILRKNGVITKEFIATATTIVYYYALPAKLFQNVVESDFYSLFNIKFILFTTGATVLSFILIWAFATILIKDRSKISAFVHGAYRGNYVYIGLPITQNILQTEIIPSSILIIAFVLPIYNILSVILLSYYSGQRDKLSFGNLTLSIIKNPMIVAILAALPISLLKLELPFSISKSMNYIGTLATPMALLLVGASIRFHTFTSNKKLIISSSIIKVMIQPLIFIPFAVLFGFHSQDIVTIYVMLATPTAMNAYIMTKKLGGDGEISAGIIVLTVLLSVVTIPMGAYIFKLLGII